ncbi:hypothetical protein [Cellulomonas sp. WB94]|nr:hypothetical protein [Cellulomonas sp. WB94]
MSAWQDRNGARASAADVHEHGVVAELDIVGAHGADLMALESSAQGE